MRQEDNMKLIKHGLDQAKFPSTLEPILRNNVFRQELQDANLILDASNQVTRKFQIRVTPVNFS
jgi:hypothetical protein